MRTIVQLAVGAVVYFLTVQAMYWPVIMKPGTEVQFWQMRWAAGIGYWVGAPAVAAISVSPLSGMLQDILAHIFALIWAGVTYWLAGYPVRYFAASRSPRAT